MLKLANYIKFLLFILTILFLSSCAIFKLSKFTKDKPIVYTSQKFNYQISAPKGGWKITHKQINQVADVEFSFDETIVIVVVIAEFSDNLSIPQLKRIGLQNLENVSKKMKLENEEWFLIGNVPAVKTYTFAQIGERDYEFVHLFTSYQGIIYQVACLSPVDKYARNEIYFDEIFSSFKFLGEREEWKKLHISKLTEYTSENYFYSITANEPDWKQIKIAKHQNTDLQFISLQEDATIIVAIVNELTLDDMRFRFYGSVMARNMEVFSDDSIEVNGYEGFKLTFGGEKYGEIVALDAGDGIVIFSLDTYTGLEGKYSIEFDKILRSFKILSL